MSNQYTHQWRWHKHHPERKGQRCQPIEYQPLYGTVTVRFEDGHTMKASRDAIVRIMPDPVHFAAGSLMRNGISIVKTQCGLTIEYRTNKPNNHTHHQDAITCDGCRESMQLADVSTTSKE